MPTYEGGVLRVYRLPMIVEAADPEEARQKIAKIYDGMRSGYDGSQDIFEGYELPVRKWPIEETNDGNTVLAEEGVDHWSSWAI
jgi:hypothetical protein